MKKKVTCESGRKSSQRIFSVKACIRFACSFCMWLLYMQAVLRSGNICLPAYVYVRLYCTCGWVWLEVSSFSPLWSKWQGSGTQLSSLTHRAIGNVCWQPLADQPTHLAQIRSYLSKALCTQWKWLPRWSKPI